MRTLISPRSLAALAFTLPMLTASGCKKGPGSNDPTDGARVTNQETVNLFGFEESQIHYIHYNIKRRGRVLLARYDPAHPEGFEILDCAVQAPWEYVDADGRHTQKMHIRNSGELQAKVPLGVARFSSYVTAGSELAFEYVTVGSYALREDPRVPRNDPECARATHYVASLSVGAFRFDELRSAAGSVGANVPGGAGGSIGGSRESGESSSTGSLEGCMSEDRADCHMPMQMLLIPLSDRYWIEENGGSVTPVTQAQVETVAEGSRGTSKVQVSVTEEAWRPGYYMAMTMTKLLSFATYMVEETNYGLDGDGTSIFGGYLTSNSPLHLGRTLEGGREYVFFGAATMDDDVDIRILDSNGTEVAHDVHNDSQPVVTFTPPATANYQIYMTLNGENAETFGGMGVATNAGFSVSADLLQNVFQSIMNRGIEASEALKTAGATGAVFLDSPGDWTIQGTILQPGEAIRQSGIQLPENRVALFMAVGHDPKVDIDIQVKDDAGKEWTDAENDGIPVVLLDEPSGQQNYQFLVSYPKASPEPTFAASLILLNGTN